MIAAREKRVLHTYMHSLFDKAVFQKLPGYWYWSERLKGFRLQSLILPHLLLSTYSAFCKVQSLSQIASICFFVHPTLKIFCLWNQLLIMLFARLLNLPVFVSKVRCFSSWDPAFACCFCLLDLAASRWEIVSISFAILKQLKTFILCKAFNIWIVFNVQRFRILLSNIGAM